MVWAIPRSIATTKGITIVFFSSAYLDVSVQRVRLPYNGIMPIARHWVAPFGNLRINSYLHLPAAYRSLSRPSSPLRAKASSVRPCLLSYCLWRYPACLGITPSTPLRTALPASLFTLSFLPACQ